MTIAVTHTKVSAISDDAASAAAGEVVPSDWNAAHTLTGTVGIAQGGTGAVTAETGFDALAPTTTQGDIIFRNATVNTRLGTGTSGQVLISGGAGANPSWSSGGSGDALVANPLSQFAATTSAQLAGVISNETGSGLLVFATSPQLTTPLLGTPTSGIMTNVTGTASGLTAGNVTTNANLTGGVTSVGNAATVITNANLTGGVTSVGNAATVVTNANLTGDVTSTGNAAVIGSTKVTSAMINSDVYSTDHSWSGVQTFTGPILGTPASGTLTNCTALPVAGITASTSAALGVGSVELGHATDTTITRDAAGSMAIEGVKVATVGVQTIWIPAKAMTAATTNGPASGTVEQTTNKNMTLSLDFDATTSEIAQFTVAFPKSWNLGTVSFVPHWTAASGSGTFICNLAAVAVSNDDALDVAFGTLQSSTDTLITAYDNHVGPASSAITIAGTPAALDLVNFKISRDVADTIAVDVKLIGIQLYYTTSAASDT